jgi:integrase
MTVFRRGTYWIEFWKDGKRYRKSTGVANKRAAEEIERGFRTALAKGDVGITARKRIPLFRDAMADYLRWSEKQHGAKLATHRRYVTSSVALLRHFKLLSLEKITPDEVERFKTARLNEAKTVRSKDGRKAVEGMIRPATVNRELACLRAMFNHAIKADLPLKNPVSKFGAKTLPEENEQTRVLSHREEAKYLASASAMLRDVATLMLETGMRPEEVYRIQPRNVHLDEGFLFNPFGKTRAARRRISLTACAKAVVARRMEACKGAYLFPHDSDADRPVPKVNNAHDSALQLSKVAHFRLYDCRHTWATRAAEAGIDLVTLAAMLGHSKINMVLRYAHPTQEHQAKAMDKLEAFNARRQMEEFKEVSALTQ